MQTPPGKGGAAENCVPASKVRTRDVGSFQAPRQDFFSARADRADVDDRNRSQIVIVEPGFVLERGKRIGFIAVGRNGCAVNDADDDFVGVFPSLKEAIAVLRLLARAVASRRGLYLVADSARQQP